MACLRNVELNQVHHHQRQYRPEEQFSYSRNHNYTWHSKDSSLTQNYYVEIEDKQGKQEPQKQIQQNTTKRQSRHDNHFNKKSINRSPYDDDFNLFKEKLLQTDDHLVVNGNGNVNGKGNIDSSTAELLFKKQQENIATTQTHRRRRSGTWPRTRSLNAPPPLPQFGPCGRIMKNPAMVMHIQDPAGQRLSWHKPPLTVLVIKKVCDSSVLAPFVQLIDWLLKEKNMSVWVEYAVLEEKLLRSDVKLRNAAEKKRHEKFSGIRERFLSLRDKLVFFIDARDDLTNRIDFIICIGGDGTLLYASQLFQHSVPPVMAFHLGSLGFLTPFRFDNFQEQVTNVLEGHAALTLRSRLRCIIQRKAKGETQNKLQQEQQQQQQQQSDGMTEENQRQVPVEQRTNGSTYPDEDAESILVLNDVVISRGVSSYLSNVDLFLDGKYITTVQGDGLIVSTPTGSTAYAVAAGASMIHPSVPAIMVTPICPHSLSFRPIVVPAGVELMISVSPDSRNTSLISFDGRNRQELFHGDTLRVTTSIYPVPSICAIDQVTDWFDSLANGLHWNVRKRQKCLDELSDLTASFSSDEVNTNTADISKLKI